MNNIEKIKKDPFYKIVYERYGIDKVIAAGYFDDGIDKIDYKLNLLTTPFNKIKDNIKKINEIKNNDKFIVLLSTGGFNPIHKDHINMMELAKYELESKGYNVVGGYLSPCNLSYTLKKPFSNPNCDILYEAQKCIQQNDWIDIDPFEYLYMPSTINFTNVIIRLEKYLKLHVDDKIQVAYVFGGDNAEFAYCFEEYGLAVCVARKGYEKIFETVLNNVNSKNLFYVKRYDKFYGFCSREIRKATNYEQQYRKGSFIIRNEGILPLDNFEQTRNLYVAQDLFVKLLSRIFTKYLNINIEIVDINDQIKYANEFIGNKQTISMDSYYNGTYPLDVSRLFEMDSQIKYKKLIGRNGFNIKEQVKNIPNGEYILVDDDSVSGNTLKSVKNELPNTIKIVNTFLLSSIFENAPFDVVDCRDFILGANNAGLMVNFKNKNIRVPYILPYVSLTSRASIPSDKEVEFTLDVLNLNKIFYEQIDDIKLSMLNKDFQYLMNYIGFKKEDSVIKIIEWHIDMLKK